MDATRARAPDPTPGLAELEALCGWTAARLRALTRAALLGRGDDPDVFDLALLTHRAARAGAAAARRPDRPCAPDAARGGPSGGQSGRRAAAAQARAARCVRSARSKTSGS